MSTPTRKTLPLIGTTPYMHGQIVKDAQYALAHNRFGNFKPGKIDGVYAHISESATRRAKYAIGYEKRRVNGAYGRDLHDYLKPNGKRLSPFMQARRKLRVKQMEKRVTAKGKALDVALAEARKHVTESPYGSNSQPYGRWFGFNRVAWCAIFVSFCLDRGGLKGLRTALAYQWEWWGAARMHGLSITHDPEPGDIVVYHHGQGHTGLFRRWIDREHGVFEAVEGNTSAHGSQDNGGAVLIQRRDTGWTRTVFVRVGA